MPKKLKYGIISGTPNYTYTCKIKTSEVLSAKSGRYVVFDTGSAHCKVAPDNATKISGYIEDSLTIDASTEEAFPVASNPDQFVCELPYASAGTAQTSLTAAVLLTLFSDIGDIFVDGSDIQYADVAQSENIMRIVGGDITIPTLYITILNETLGNVT